VYVPASFKEEQVPVLHDAIRRTGLAMLVTMGPGGLQASHVPMLLDAEPAPFGTLHGHVARANPQWRTSAADVEALAIFVGPDAYITPAWYATKAETGKVVPTWNYVAVHAYGPLSFFDDPDRLLALVTKLTMSHEAARPEPWAVSDAPAEYVQGMLRSIVGFEMPIARLEGKWKMSQNRPGRDVAGVVEGLAREGGAAKAEVARIVARVNQEGR
jgi:transcriptional regulator